MRDPRNLKPGSFDFVWSSCALEHLGDLQAGQQFVQKSIELLNPGGVFAHTTEFNVSSDDQTLEEGWAVIYRKRDLAILFDLLSDSGVECAPLDLDPGRNQADQQHDEPPYYESGRHHVKLWFEGYVMTSVLLLGQKRR